MCDIFIMCFVLSEILSFTFLSFHSDFRVHLVFNYYFCRFDTDFCFSFTLVFDIFIVFLVCSKFCRIVYVCFMFLVTFHVMVSVLITFFVFI